MHPRMAELLFYVGDLEWTGLCGDWDCWSTCGEPGQASGLCIAYHDDDHDDHDDDDVLL